MKYPNVVYFFHEDDNSIPEMAEALLIDDNVIPEQVLSLLEPFLYLTKVNLTLVDNCEDDPNADGSFYAVQTDNEHGKELILSNFEIPQESVTVKVLDDYPEDIVDTVKHFNALYNCRQFLDVDLLRVSTEHGVKTIEPFRYYYHAGECTPGDGKPFRAVDIRNASVPLEEYLRHAREDFESFNMWLDELLDGAKQYVKELSPRQLVTNLGKDLQHISPLRREDTSTDIPDGIYF
ncbi:MAG: hypothetical protein K6E35_06260 [Bacteroidales bacterium]|nr:hypothetical protein [Bacteroidales bacterium]